MQRIPAAMVWATAALWTACGAETTPAPKGDAVAAQGDGQDAEASPPARPFAAVQGAHAGFAVVDITPKLLESYTDLNKNGKFDGCPNQPKGGSDKCKEPFDDQNGNGIFDTAWIAGFGSSRAATGVHDPITVRAAVYAHGEAYVALVSVDAIGLGGDHILKAEAELAKAGWAAGRVIVSSTHTHQGPDVRGMWGSQMPGNIFSGANPAYNAQVRTGIVQAVQQAAAGLQAATLQIGTVRMRDRSEWFNGKPFGGKNPKPRVHGLIHDIRDPVIASDQVLAVQAKGKDGKTLGTLVGFSAHPELLGGDNTLLSADYVHDVRQRVEAKLGGTAVFVSECLGGMQSGLGAEVPLVDAQGAWQWQKDKDGNPEPQWAKPDSWELARSYGYHVADAALAALDKGEALDLANLAVRHAPFVVPADNFELKIMVAIGLFDLDKSIAKTDPQTCPWYNPEDTSDPGCMPERVWHVRLGALELLTAPGELLPELFWGPDGDDPRWLAEAATATARGVERGSVYFPQHDKDCDAVPWAECQMTPEVGDCDCTAMHDLPFRQGPEPAMVPAAALLKSKYKFLVGNAGDHLGYIVPESDFHRAVSQLAGVDGDHYEEVVSLSFRMATLWYKALAGMLQQPLP